MRNWIKKIPENPKISCIITYEEKVVQPKKTMVEYQLSPTNNSTVTQQVSLTLEDMEPSLRTATSSNASSCTSTATQAIALISANIQFQTLTSSSSSPSPLNLNNGSPSAENVWKKRNLENSVVIPETQVAKSKKQI